jgi:predicted small secreted protein
MKRQIRLIPLLVILALSLSGCGQMSEGVQVGTTKIAVSEIQKSIDQILQERKGVDTSQMQLLFGADLATSQAQLQVISLITDQIAKDKNIQISKSDIEQRKTEIEQQLIDQGGDLKSALVGAGIASSNLDKYLNITLVTQKLSTNLKAAGVADEQIDSEVSKIIGSTAKSLKVKINPRYGKWNYETVSIEPVDNTLGAVVNR